MIPSNNNEHVNNMNRIKAGLMQFIGAIMTSSDDAVRQDGCAALCDALLALAYDKERDEFNMWTMRPAFRSVWHVMKQRHSLMKKDLKNVEATPERENALNEVAMFLAEFKKNKHIKGLYLTGDFGVGKTYILAGVANAIARQGSRVVFLHVPSFIASLGSHFQDNSLNDEIDRIASAPVLIFDDIGAETLSEWSRDDVLGVILQKRMDNVLPTFFSSNITMDGLNEHFAETRNSVDEVKARRLMERVRFLNKEVFVGGKNRRN